MTDDLHFQSDATSVAGLGSTLDVDYQFILRAFFMTVGQGDE